MVKAGPKFMKASSHSANFESGQQRGLPQPPLELPYDAAAPLIDLPAPAGLPVPPLDLRTLIEARRTHRHYADEPISLAELSYLLWCTQGVQEQTPQRTRRTVPSAGARHAFETSLLVNRVEGLPPGLYRYVALRHKLLAVRREDTLADDMMAACLQQTQVKDSAVAFLWSAVVQRMAWRYGERGYRYLHLDAGHVCQNLYLAAESIGCGVCAIAAFDDEALNDFLGLDGKEQFVIYVGTVGRKKR